MDNIFIIYKISFDSQENHSPIISEVIGYDESFDNAKSIIELLESQSKKYKGYDGNTYPKFRIVKQDKLNEELKAQGENKNER